MLCCGMDIGARSIDAVLYDGARVTASLVRDTGSRPRDNALAAFEELLAAAGVSRGDVDAVTATGYGRRYFEQADRTASEILCHARGVFHLFPRARTVIDIGGQDSKMIGLTGDGGIADFVMNDRCAAGTGRFLEIVGQTLDVPLEEMWNATKDENEACEISSVCAVFAESEIVGLLQRGTRPGVILRGVFRAIARRTIAMGAQVGLRKEIVFTGGVARNPGVKQALEEETGCRVNVPGDPQTTGALGAALIACEAASAKT